MLPCVNFFVTHHKAWFLDLWPKVTTRISGVCLLKLMFFSRRGTSKIMQKAFNIWRGGPFQDPPPIRYWNNLWQSITITLSLHQGFWGLCWPAGHFMSLTASSGHFFDISANQNCFWLCWWGVLTLEKASGVRCRCPIPQNTGCYWNWLVTSWRLTDADSATVNGRICGYRKPTIHVKLFACYKITM